MSVLHVISDTVRAFGRNVNRIEPTTAIIVASGNSTRMGKGVSKQMLLLEDIPVVVRTIMAFEESEYIKDIIVVAKEEEFYLYKEFQRIYKFKKLRKLVKGGNTRQESVKNGFFAIEKGTRFVAIHDGARCLVTPDNIKDVCHAAYKCGAATAAHRATDSVKVTDGKSRFIDYSAVRDHIWLAQTPQVFKSEIYEMALEKADAYKTVATDDNALVESLGCRIKLVECGSTNIKITTPEDLHLAYGILKAREENK